LSFSIEEAESRIAARVYLGFKILTEVVPRILEEGRWIGERIALAKTWYMYLCSVEECPEVDRDPRKWGSKDLETIAEALVSYAYRLLEPALRARPSMVRERGSIGLEELPF